ncbi:sulfate adenylyltransferase, partial [Vibrio fluvialis]|nr:sulfate adenylyltransferase [Vibrio fluvialis]EKO3984915.1 sulfate adenylyltransferase [Vibrio fluvialis]
MTRHSVKRGLILLAVLTVSSLAGALNTQEQQWVDA